MEGKISVPTYIHNTRTVVKGKGNLNIIKPKNGISSAIFEVNE
jgi:hypothetical protein